MARDDDLVRRIQIGVERGLEIAQAVKDARDPVARQHRKAVAAHERAVRRYHRRARSLRRQETTGAAVAGIAGTIGIVDVVTEAVTAAGGVYGPAWAWIVAAVAGGGAAVAARQSRRRLRPPQAILAPAPPPRPLPPDAIGAQETARLAALRRQLAAVIPAIERLHPAAGDEVSRADAEAAPVLAGQVERLAALHAITRDLPGSPPAQAARQAAEEVRARLATGTAAYEQLLSAAATMLAAPDLARGTSDVLDPAVAALTAYAHGLQRAADA